MVQEWIGRKTTRFVCSGMVPDCLGRPIHELEVRRHEKGARLPLVQCYTMINVMIVMKTSFVLVFVYSIAVRGTVLSQADFIDLVINFGDLVKTIQRTILRNGCLGGLRRKGERWSTMRTN